MAISKNLTDLELEKFGEVSPGVPGVRIIGTNFSGTFTVSGLQNGGRVTEVTLDQNSWTPLPATPLLNRNAIVIQNASSEEIKVNYRSDVGYVGIKIGAGSERAYDIKDTIIIYGRSVSSTVTINVEELS